MKSLIINLSEEQIQNILGEGDKNPLYKTLLTAYPEYKPIPTIESLYNEGKIGGYWINDDGTILYVDYVDGGTEVVNGVAPTEEAVKRTVIEYKLLHLIKANGVEGTDFTISYTKLSNEILLFEYDGLLTGVLRIGGDYDKCIRFVKNYEKLIKEYFSTFNA